MSYQSGQQSYLWRSKPALPVVEQRGLAGPAQWLLWDRWERCRDIGHNTTCSQAGAHLAPNGRGRYLTCQVSCAIGGAPPYLVGRFIAPSLQPPSFLLFQRFFRSPRINALGTIGEKNR